jgi:hypothetical protein
MTGTGSITGTFVKMPGIAPDVPIANGLTHGKLKAGGMPRFVHQASIISSMHLHVRGGWMYL